MTAERLAQLRRFAHYAAYHVPTAELVMGLKDAEAGDDMLELCDAAAALSELLAACRDAEQSLLHARASKNPDVNQAAIILFEAIAKAEGR